MTTLKSEIEARLRDAVAAAAGDEHRGADPLVRPAAQQKFGDFQANLAMGLGKRLGQPPRKLAEQIVEQLDGSGLIARADVAGPGFINLTLTDTALGERAASMLADPRLGVAATDDPQHVVVDYSAPNVAKEMHIGHFRSTAIGDAIVRTLELLGHRVTRQNHLGDWGTQFGMLVEHLEDTAGEPDEAAAIRDLTAFYQAARRRFDDDPDFATRARERVVRLQSGDAPTLARWRQLVAISQVSFEADYERLGVLLGRDDVRGESAYNDQLPGVVADLAARGLLHESDGAQVVYPEGFTGKDGEPFPMIVRKGDGGFLYSTTDLAALRFRVNELGAQRIIYVTDARQSDHFAMVFRVARSAGWVGPEVRLDHVPFGMILGPDRKPYKTRSGETVRLADVLDEAEQRAAAVIAEKNPDIVGDERDRTARVVGIGALKYADLSSDRVKDYVFDWDRMLALDGNTAPYSLNAYVRVQSIFRKALVDAPVRADAPIRVDDPSERALVLRLLDLPEVVAAVGEALEPHRLCTYLFDLASELHRFYERCRVADCDEPELRASRLALCALVARGLARGLDLLGIGTVPRM